MTNPPLLVGIDWGLGDDPKGFLTILQRDSNDVYTVIDEIADVTRAEYEELCTLVGVHEPGTPWVKWRRDESKTCCDCGFVGNHAGLCLACLNARDMTGAVKHRVVSENQEHPAGRRPVAVCLSCGAEQHGKLFPHVFRGTAEGKATYHRERRALAAALLSRCIGRPVWPDDNGVREAWAVPRAKPAAKTLDGCPFAFKAPGYKCNLLRGHDGDHEPYELFPTAKEAVPKPDPRNLVQVSYDEKTWLTIDSELPPGPTVAALDALKRELGYPFIRILLAPQHIEHFDPEPPAEGMVPAAPQANWHIFAAADFGEKTAPLVWLAPPQPSCTCVDDEPGHFDPRCPHFRPPAPQIAQPAACRCLTEACPSCGPKIRDERVLRLFMDDPDLQRAYRASLQRRGT